ncbi:MAG: adenylyltransferase/cytidyltransferase family protein [Desulfobacterales bacterium]|nr:adenylyltransferase/cytidyltransferase family protein [Desulfobacterales bacterium]
MKNKPNMTRFATHVVYTAGTFDLLHKGHVELFYKCTQIGDFVIVVLNTDNFINTYKGQPPIMSYEERESVIITNQFVDLVIPNSGCEKCFYTIMNHAVTHGYENMFSIVIGDDWKYKDYAAQMGVINNDLDLFHKVVKYVPRYKGVSTTSIKNRVIAQSQKISKCGPK